MNKKFVAPSVTVLSLIPRDDLCGIEDNPLAGVGGEAGVASGNIFPED